MRLNFYVRVAAGPRTKIKVECDKSSLKNKSIRFKNGQIVTDNDICSWIEHNLEIGLAKIEKAIKVGET